MANRQPAGSGGTQNGGRGGGGGGRGRGTGMPGNMPYNPGQYGQRPGAYLPQQAYGMMPGYQYVQQQQQGMQAYGVPQAMQYAGYQVPGSTSRQPFRQPQPTVVYQQQNGAQPAEVAAAKPAPTKQAPKKKSKAIRIVNPDTKKDVVVETPAGAAASATDSSVSAATATTTATASPAAGTPGSTRKSKAIKIQRPDNGEVKTSPPATTPAATVAATAASATAPKKEAEAGAPSTAVAPASAAPRAAPTASGADAPAASEEKAGAGPPPKAPAPAENQWTPSNTAGEKSYSHAFMSAFRTVCKASPPSFRDDIEVIMANPASRGGNGGKGGNFKSGPDWMQNGFSQQSGGFRPPQRNGSNNGRRGAPSRNDGRGGPQQPRAGQKVINLPGRNREAPKLQKSENAFVISTKKKTGIEKDTFKEITVRLNKLTLEKFDILALQIKDLLVADLEKVQELVMGIFVKAIDEEFFSMIYAKLCKYLAIAVSTDDGNVEAIPMFRKTLLNCCQQEFEKATKADAAAAKLDASKKEAAAAAEKAAAEAGIETKELSKEEAAKKREEEREEGYARNKVKRHMLGNIRFIGELFKEDLVSSKIMMHCINHLVPNKNAEEENLENLCKLLETAGGKWETQMLKAKKNKKQTAENEATVKRTFATLKELTNRAGLSSRIKFAVLDILDLRDRKWKPRTESKGPKTISEVHAEANLEQIKIQQQSGGKGGGGGGRGSSGGGRRGRDNYSGGGGGGGGGRNPDGWTNVGAPRRSEKVDAGRFSGGGGGVGGGGGGLRLGAPNLGGVRLGGGPSGGGMQRKKTGASNPFAALAADNGKRVAPARGGSPLLQPKQSSLLKSAKLAKSTSPTPSTSGSSSAAIGGGAGPAATAATPLKFTKEVLDRKINGCLDEYLSIVDLSEVKESIKEWDHPDATREFALAAIKKGAEASEKNRNLFAKLFASTVGGEGGVPALTFIEAVKSFMPTLPDLMYDAPRAHEHIGAFIAAAASAAPEVIKVLLEIEHSLEAADDDGGPELPLKVALATFEAAKKASNEGKMLELYAEMGASILSFLPDTERVSNLCDRAGVKALLSVPASPVGAAGVGGADTLDSLLAADASNDQIFEWVDANVKTRDATFVARLTELIVLETSKKTTCATAEDLQKPPTVAKEAAETEAIKNRSKALKVYTDGSDELQLHALCAVQSAAVSKLKNPPGLLGRWFSHLYDMDVVLEDVFKTWETDDTVSTSATYPGKVLALTGANDLMDRLKNGAVEDDPGAD